MNILLLEIQNHKAVKCFNMELNGENLEIAGDTGTGKTTASSILWEIMNKGRDVISHGEDKSVLRVAIGDETATHYIAERITTPSKSTVKCSKMLGAKALPMDTKDFDAMISKLSVNPHKISQMKPTEQIKTLMGAADSDIDLEALDAEISEAEEDRKLAGRAARNSKPVEVPEEAEPVSVSELIAKRDVIQEKNSKTQNLLNDLEGLKNVQQHEETEYEELKARIAALNGSMLVRKERIDKGSKWAETAKILGTDDLDEQIASAEETNKAAAIYEQAIKDLEHHNMLQAMQKTADDKVKELRDHKKEVLNGISWPLEGISVDDGNITYHGVLLENLGESEQMLVTSAIAIGDIKKHEIKVVRLDGIESMSKADSDKLRDLFNENGIQVLSTRVSRGEIEEGEITIEDGCYGE